MTNLAAPFRPAARALRDVPPLLDVCEPLFLYVCRLNRSTRLASRAQPHLSQVRSEVQAIVNGMERTAGASDLGESFAKIREPLLFFVDDVIITSRLPFAGEWHRLAEEEGEPAGNEKFFDLLDIALEDPAADDRLAVFFVCLGLGFQGKHRGDRAQIDAYMARITARIGDRMDLDEQAKICPEAYHYTDRRPLAEPVTGTLFGIGIVAVILIAMALAVSGAMYFLRTDSLKRNLNTFHQLMQPAEKTK
jgi:type IV/VI secretion system ImpK/VasF family protein